jgi:hypothetical protein
MRVRWGCGGAGFALLVVPDQPPVLDQPREGAFDDPAMREDVKAPPRFRSFDHLDLQFGALFARPRGEGRPAVAAVHPQLAQPGEPIRQWLSRILAPFRSGWSVGTTAALFNRLLHMRG